MEQSNLEHFIISSHKADIITYMHDHPEAFNLMIELALADKQPYSWRAAWVLWSCMEKNDSRILNYLKEIIEILPQRKGNQQRELMLVLQRMELNSDDEGLLFDICAKIWEKTDQQSSVRYNAFRLMSGIADKYLELKEEIKTWTEPHYTVSLSAGVRKAISKRMKSLDLAE